ncbi:MAG: dienelactone hydrolase family protein [Dehalococcoidia bacterium]
MPDLTIPTTDPSRSLRAYLALPEADEPRPAVIVIHEIMGLNRDVREKADRFAAMGYVALAPHLYSGRGPMPICVVRAARELRRGSGTSFDDLEACRQWLAERPEVDPARTGVAGFCIGGGFALLYAVRAPLGAGAVFYGDVPKDSSELEGVCPVVASYGARDRVFAPQAVRLEEHLSELGVPHDIRIYDGAGHSFTSDHKGVLAKLNSWGPMKLGFNPQASSDSWQRVEGFFSAHLG